MSGDERKEKEKICLFCFFFLMLAFEAVGIGAPPRGPPSSALLLEERATFKSQSEFPSVRSSREPPV